MLIEINLHFNFVSCKVLTDLKLLSSIVFKEGQIKIKALKSFLIFSEQKTTFKMLKNILSN